MASEKRSFPGASGATLAARLDRPDGPHRAVALFAHCFTCSKDSLAASRIAGALVAAGYAVLRFDFTGLGQSEGEFGNEGFAANVDDLVAAADHLRGGGLAPSLLVGHSLGGAAVLAAAGRVPEARAVATVNAPFDPAHALRHVIRAEAEGDQVEATIAGRPFRITKAFLAAFEGQDMEARIAGLGRALIVFHAPRDQTVGIENATRIFSAARHPKSFVGLDGADHLLSDRRDAAFVGQVLAAWAGRYLADVAEDAPGPRAGPGTGGGPNGAEGVVTVAETGRPYAQAITAGHHRLGADEPASVGGGDTGPTPYDFLLAALGACTSMTLRMYAARKKMDLGRITVRLRHAKVHGADCAECEGREGRLDRIDREIAIDGALDRATRDKLLEIADKCPVHRTIENRPVVVTRITGEA